MTNELVSWDIVTLADALSKRAVSSAEATKAYLEEIGKRQSEIGAYLTVGHDSALKEADEVDRLRKNGETLPMLAGIPMALKDNLCVKGMKTSCASKILQDFVSPYSATVVQKLQKQRAVLLGKLNMDEFSMGSTNEYSAFYPVKNPVNPSYVPGGSSGGAAAAVRDFEAAFALGSDTGGSIRQPAAFCGVVGMKPTYGAVSRYGLVAFASSLDQIGPLTKTVKDSAIVLKAIAGRDEKDSTSLAHSWGNLTEGIEDGVKGMRIALPKQYFEKSLVSRSVKEAVLSAAQLYEALGAKVEEVSLPSLSKALAAYYILSSAEASSNLGRYDGVRYGFRFEGANTLDELYENTRSQGFGCEVKRRIMLGNFVLSAGYYEAYYQKAMQVRTVVKQEFEAILSKSDLILAPVTPTTAYKRGEKDKDSFSIYQGDACTVPVNIAGLPALALPCGEDEKGLPIGMQLIGGPFGERLLYRAGYTFEQAAHMGVEKWR